MHELHTTGNLQHYFPNIALSPEICRIQKLLQINGAKFHIQKVIFGINGSACMQHSLFQNMDDVRTGAVCVFRNGEQLAK